MSENPFAIDEKFEQQVAEYLAKQSKFFLRHPQLMEDIEITHETGSAISLMEHKIKILQEKSDQRRDQLADLIEVARDNERLTQRLHQLTLNLIEARSLNDVLSTLQDELRNKFSADAVELKLFVSEELEALGNDGSVAHYWDFMQADKPTCGALDKEKLHSLFGDQAGDQGSAALIPIRTSTLSGILAIGSHDADHFHQGKGVDFLIRLGELVSLTLQAVGAASDLPLDATG